MLRFVPSIRKKITVGFYGTVTIILALSLFTFIDLKYLERKVVFGEAISEFFDTALEIRRFEKNYFLYGKKSDYAENKTYTAKARRLLEDNLKGFQTIADAGQISALRNDLLLYGTLMEKFVSLSHGKSGDSKELTILEQDIRKTGKDITTLAESISKTERRNLQITLYKSRTILFFSIVCLSLVAIIVGQMLTRLIVRPLKSLEKSMKVIADGRFEPVSIDSKDKEILSLTSAFNKMLRELEIRQRHLVQSEKLASLGTLLSGVAHELNNPLSNISTSSQILTEEIEDPDLAYKKGLLEQIEEQTVRARNIVRSLLDFSRDKDFKKEHVSLRKLFEETIQFVKGQIPTHVEIKLDIPGDIFIIADKQRIQQAFLNLIKNAIESIVGEGTVTVISRKIIGEEEMDFVKSLLLEECEMRVPENRKEDVVYIKICDTGIGIPHDVLPKIFDPFFTTKDVGQGSGLGLFIVHEIIEEHCGCIAVDSVEGAGTTFLIRLPVKDDTAQECAEHEA
jgi:signal transduction histidine kinase